MFVVVIWCSLFVVFVFFVPCVLIDACGLLFVVCCLLFVVCCPLIVIVVC